MIEDIKQKYENIENSVNAKDYMNNFSECFDTMQDNRVNTNLLKELYFEFIDQVYSKTKIEQFIADELEKVLIQLEKVLDDKGKEYLKIYDYLQYKATDNQGLESFIYGFCLANELSRLSNSYANNNKLLTELIAKYRNGGDDENG